MPLTPGTPTNFHGDANDRPMYIQPSSCVENMSYSGLVGAATGAFYGGCIMAWNPDNYAVTRHSHPRLMGGAGIASSAAIMKKIGAPTIWLTATCMTFSLVDCMAESLREIKDPWNAVFGGIAAGLVMGSTTRRWDYMTVAAMGCGVAAGALELYGPYTEHDPEYIRRKVYDTLPLKHEESQTLKQLKEKYPKFKDL
mmetsp:Transcript_21732/g.33165  ORF Transcript_21732/g.33165 Transcript_21732/m.33165 type:complete len:197 (-) Transcript_21732:160-750(-)|eukprot:CAMPEP_0118696158 /NCGR_PEP_ID=MMETSP0800-20121206/13668_1 /TAXON_ID=210618 ORGANISM="Striatella unipunctata, Strain CCMP2910" /NCGR_SAMPLE_ID=MMETSP0800 /ASSEMBLY_ACC=CAM_ASM_000638 /LENGTH=196 /DNA_ID=CAMNT_0006595193 /DNA_START=27 /DNA_END=617 /DNA_ORIENTATION=+